MNTFSKPPVWFWIISGVLVAWNAMGAAAYLGDVSMTAEDLAALPAAQAAIYEDTPVWAMSGYAIAVWVGLAAALLLLLRKRWAITAFIISLVGIVIQQTHIFFLSDSLEVYGTGGLILPLVVLVAGIASIWFSRYAAQQRWIS